MEQVGSIVGCLSVPMDEIAEETVDKRSVSVSTIDFLISSVDAKPSSELDKHVRVTNFPDV